VLTIELDSLTCSNADSRQNVGAADIAAVHEHSAVPVS